MPIPERVRKPDSVIKEELKRDHTEFRLKWLHPEYCFRCVIMRWLLVGFALYGIYSLIF